MKSLFFLMLLLFTAFATDGQIPEVEWKRSYGGSDNDYGNVVVTTTDGGSIVAGSAYSKDGDVTFNHGLEDIWILKLSASGSIEWQRTYGGSGNEMNPSILQTSDGGYVVAGTSSSNDGDVSGGHGSSDYWVFKLDKKGNIIWQRCFGGSKSELACSIVSCGNDGFIVVGASYSSDGDVTGHHQSFDTIQQNADYWAIKMDQNGNLLWQKSLGSRENDIPYAVIRTSDGNYIVAGEGGQANGDITLNLGFSDCWLVKLSGNGDVIWQHSVGSDHGDRPYAIYETTDGYLLLTGIRIGYEYDWDDDVWEEANIDCFLTKLSANADSLWYVFAGGPSYDKGYSVVEAEEGAGRRYIVAGYSGSRNCDTSVAALSHFASNIWMQQYSINGDLLESTCMADSMTSGVGNMVKTKDGGLLMTGGKVVIKGVGTSNIAKVDLQVIKFKGTVNIDDSTGIDQLISAGPNPTTGLLFFESHDALTIRAYDVLGRMVAEVSDTKILSLAGMPAAVYFVRAFGQTGGLVFQQKTVKQ